MSTIGIDHGANSVCALVVRYADGAEFGSAVVESPSGDEAAPHDESDCRRARETQASLPGSCGFPSPHAAP